MRRRAGSEPESPDIRHEIMASVGQSAFRQFNMVFALTGLIPLGIGIYVLTAKLFTLEIFAGLTGVYFLLALVLMCLGFLMGRRILRDVLLRLISASVQLRQREVVKSGFIANVAYELRPPLSAVGLSLKNMADGLLGALSDLQCRAINDCQRIVGRLERLTADLIDATDTEQHTPQLQRDVFDLADVVREALQTTAVYFTAHRLTTAVELPPRPVLFFGDRDKLMQAVGSLIDYATTYSADGGAIRVTLASLPQELQLVVSFQHARRPAGAAGEAAATPLSPGLRVAKGLFERHHGQLWIDARGPTCQLGVVLPIMELKDAQRRRGS